MTRPTGYTVIVVRAWRDRDGLKIRMAARSGPEAAGVTAVETSAEAALARFDLWIRDVEEFGVVPSDPSSS